MARQQQADRFGRMLARWLGRTKLPLSRLGRSLALLVPRYRIRRIDGNGISEAKMEEMSPHTAATIDQVFRLVNREIWIVTSADGEAKPPRRGGLLATWVAQASLDPAQPLVIAAIAKNHFTAELIGGSGSFAAHLISAEQIELAWRFGIGSGRDRDKLAGLSTRFAATGAPVLIDCLAWLDCRVLTSYDAGDRIFFWADVTDGGRTGDGQPLREQELFAAADDRQRGQLRENLLEELRIQSPLMAAWREGLK